MNGMKNEKRPHQRRNQLGVSYMEVTAALFIFSMGVLGAFQMFHYSLDKMRFVKESDVALRAIQNEIETLRAAPFASLHDGDSPYRSSTPGLNQLLHAAPLVRVTPWNPALPGVKKVEVSVAWTGDGGRTITKTVDTLIADRGVWP